MLGTTYLVKSGEAEAEIVLGENPSRMATFAARELQNYIEKMSGSKLPVVAEPSDGVSVKVYVGKSQFTDELGLKTDGLQHGAFRMASGPDWLALLGPDKDFEPVEPWGRNRNRPETERINAEWDKITGDTFWNNFREIYARYHEELGIWDFDDTGTLNAVTEFLRGEGVRWFAPGEIGEVVPEKSTIALPDSLDKTVVPDFPLRRISYYHDFMGVPELSLWNLRMGLNHGHDLIGMTQPGHGIKFVLMRDEMKEAHPEMYAIWNGERATDAKNAGMPSLGEPKLMEKHLKYSRAVFDHFDEPMISIDMPDGFSQQICENDQALGTPERGFRGSMSDYVWAYLDKVARQLNESHPEKMVSGLVYGAYQQPPEDLDTLSPNLALIECRNRSTFIDKERQVYHRDLRNAWLEKLPSKQYFTWDYYLSNTPEAAGRPVFYPRIIAEDLRELKGISMGDNIEVYNHRPDKMGEFKWDEFATNHLNLYVTSRLWWDANQDVDALLEDYYSNYYGTAAPEMKAFVEYSEAHWDAMRRDPEKISIALELLDKARSAAEPDSVYAERIDRIVVYTRPLENMRNQLSKKRESDRTYRVLIASQENSPMRDNPLDGKLEPEFWPNVRVATLVSAMDGSRAALTSRFQILRDADFLYFGIYFDEPDMANLNIPTTANGDPKILEGDFVSLLLETNSHSYYEIAVNPAGAVYEIDHGENGSAEWSSKAEVGVYQGEDFWSVEIRLPIAGEGARIVDRLVGLDGEQPRELYPWHFNVGRQRVRDGKIELFTFSPTGSENFRELEKLGLMWGK